MDGGDGGRERREKGRGRNIEWKGGVREGEGKGRMEWIYENPNLSCCMGEQRKSGSSGFCSRVLSISCLLPYRTYTDSAGTGIFPLFNPVTSRERERERERERCVVWAALLACLLD